MIVMALAAAAAQATAPAADAMGATVELMVMREVTGDRARPGAEVRLSVNRSVAVAGGTIPYGASAFGEVVEASPSGLAMRRGAIAIRLTRLVIGGRDVALTGEFSARGNGGRGDDAVKVLFVPIYALFAPGNVGKVKAGQIVTGRLPPGFSLPATAAP